MSSCNYVFYDHSFGIVSIGENENAAYVKYGSSAYRPYIRTSR